MSQPLCPVLFRKLEERFGTVLFSVEGEEMVFDSKVPLLGPRAVSGHGPIQKEDILHYGEYYRVCCPKCGDDRHRLFINHRVAEFPWLIICYNENCYSTAAQRDQLLRYVFHTRPPRKLPVVRGRTDNAKLHKVQAPGLMFNLQELPRSHPANDYLASRGFDPYELGRRYGVSYCESSTEFRQCVNRIIAPVMMNGIMVGWQARFIGDRNWKAASVPKYFDMPGMAKRLMFYNYDEAKRQPFIVLNEGVTDVWSVGPCAMSTLGDSVTFAQRMILSFEPFKFKPIVMMYDGDAVIVNREQAEQIRKSHLAPVIVCELPPEKDPGNYDVETNLGMIYTAAEKQGVNLPALVA